MFSNPNGQVFKLRTGENPTDYGEVLPEPEPITEVE